MAKEMTKSGRTQRYVDIQRQPPEERAVKERLQDFQEIAARFSESEARRQASRCEQCGVPYCHVYCPLHNNIPDWLLLTAEGRFEEAYRLAEATNNLPEICRRFAANAVRLQLHALPDNLANFPRAPTLPEAVSHRSMTTLPARLVKIGAKIVRHGRSITFQMAEVVVWPELFQQILDAIAALRPSPPVRC